MPHQTVHVRPTWAVVMFTSLANAPWVSFANRNVVAKWRAPTQTPTPPLGIRRTPDFIALLRGRPSHAHPAIGAQSLGQVQPPYHADGARDDALSPAFARHHRRRRDIRG